MIPFCFRNREWRCSGDAALNWLVRNTTGKLAGPTNSRPQIFVVAHYDIITAGENWVAVVASGLLQALQARVGARA
jgi:hypothetical protein